MSEKYIPLYRKYRPKNLQEVVGQEHIKKALTNAISLNKISHAYLFTGPRGTGKTSAARIMAKSLNCLQGPTITPCEVCPSCIDIKNSTPMDVIEIDAASNRSVEDARNILEKIQYVPVNGKFKIYIIDEVHMLTTPAFNALLKTLEEPPENVIFILATTEPHKVLETITSRCQRFDFRRITTEDIVAHLKNISELEKIKIDDDALFTIAKNAAGGMRDSLALLDQVSVLDSTRKITSEDINALLGKLSFDVLNNLSEQIIQSKPQEAIENLEQIYNSGNEPTQILVNLLTYFKNLLIVKNCKETKLLVDLTQLNESQIKTLQNQSTNVDTHQIVFLIERISYYIKELKTTTNQHLWLEISMIDLANLAQNTSLLKLQERISKLESGAPIQQSVQSYVTQPAPIPAKSTVMESISKNIEPPKPTEAPKPIKQETKVEEAKVVEAETIEKTEPEDFSPMPKAQTVQTQDGDIMVLWSQFLSLLNQKKPSACAMVSQQSSPVEFSAEKIVLVCKNSFYLKALTTDDKKNAITITAEEFFNTKDINLTVRLSNPNDAPIAPQPVVEKKKPLTKEQPPQEDDDIEIDEVIAEISITKEASAKVNTKPMHSDQVTMVMNLFDGKYID